MDKQTRDLTKCASCGGISIYKVNRNSITEPQKREPISDGELDEKLGAIEWGKKLSCVDSLRWFRLDAVKFGFRLAEKHHGISKN